MKRIMVIGAGQFQVPLIKFCKQRQYYVIAVDYDASAEGFKYSDVSLNISTIDKEKVIQAATEWKIDAILTTSDFPVRTVAYVCENTGLMGLSSISAELCTNKYLFRTRLKASGINTPRFWSIRGSDELMQLKDAEFPLVVKPVDSSASRGVSMVDSFDALRNAFTEAIQYSKSGQVVVEDYLSGPEYSVETLIQNGNIEIIAITEKSTSREPYFIEERHIIPAQLTPEQEIDIKQMVIKAIRAVGLDNSAAHVELKLTANGPVIIEMGARLGGDYITSDLVPLATGVDMIENIVRIGLGEPIITSQSSRKFAGIQFVTPNNYQEIAKIESAIKQRKQVVRFEMNQPHSNSYKSSFDRCGYYIGVADSREELIKALNYR